MSEPAAAASHAARRRRSAVMALLDDAMSEVAQARAGGRDVTTVDIHVAFLRPPPERLTASARACAGGKSVCFCEAEVADEDGRIVARAMGTLRYCEARRGPAVERAQRIDGRAS